MLRDPTGHGEGWISRFGIVLWLRFSFAVQFIAVKKKALVLSLLKVSATYFESDFGSDWVRLKLYCALVQTL